MKRATTQRFRVVPAARTAFLCASLIGCVLLYGVPASHEVIAQSSGPEGGFLASPNDQERRWLREHPAIRVGSDRAWPPFEFLRSDGELDGLAAGYLRLLEDKLGVDFETSPDLPWTFVGNLASTRRNLQALDLVNLRVAAVAVSLSSRCSRRSPGWHTGSYGAMPRSCSHPARPGSAVCWW